MIGGENHDEILNFLLSISSEIDKLSGENNTLRLVFQDGPDNQLIDDASRCSSDSNGTIELLDGDNELSRDAIDVDEYSIEHEENLVDDSDIEL